ncbi:MAG: hypothetical protein JO224_13740 [Pelomonas sp.]|nr:hypothetical protein [Roseateles sp.]
MNPSHKPPALALCAALLATLVACGGGGGGTDMTGTTTAPAGNTGGSATTSGAAPGATSSGAITAFGSVFVNGHEFNIANASVVDDDTGATSASTAGLEVGQVVDVKAAATSSDAAPVAQALHIHPLVRGYVDASASNTLTVMGQTIEISSTTVFSDHRACLTASTNPCTAVDGIDDLALTSGSTATPGSYVSVDGYLFNSGAGSVNVVAALVSVHDAPTSTNYAAAFKAEGPISALGNGTLTIAGLTVNLGSATCYAAGAQASCASAFALGQVVSAIAATSPSLPATTLTAQDVLLRNQLPVTTAGASVELEGAVSAVSGTTFTVRGVSVDASALPSGEAIPVVGDIVVVAGTVAASGTSVAATDVQIRRAARSASYAFEGDLGSVVAGSAANTYTITLMGQAITVNANTRLADLSTAGWFSNQQANTPFNIGNFQTYLDASSSQHMIVSTAADASGNLQALSIVIVRASSVSGVAGIVDASPAPVNSTTAGTPTTFSIHGVPISVAPGSFGMLMRRQTSTTINAGDEVIAVGSYANGMLTVSGTPSLHNYVIDTGVPRQGDCPGF